MYVLGVKFKVAKGKEKEAVKLLSGVIDKVRKNEKGTMMYDLHQKIGDSTELFLYERYPDKKAWEQGHWTQPYVGEMRDALGACLAGPPEMTEYETLTVK